MPGRSNARRRWISAGADTTTTASQPRSPPGFEQERNIEHHHGRTADLRIGDEFVPRSGDQGMHDSFQASQRRIVAKNHFRKLGAVDLAAFGRTGEGTLDRRHGFALIKRVHDGIGIMNRHAEFGKKLRGPRFAHAERTGQAENERPLAAHDVRHPRRRRKSSAASSGNPRMVK